jgi:hypothetical protein
VAIERLANGIRSRRRARTHLPGTARKCGRRRGSAGRWRGWWRHSISAAPTPAFPRITSSPATLPPLSPPHLCLRLPRLAPPLALLLLCLSLSLSAVSISRQVFVVSPQRDHPVKQVNSALNMLICAFVRRNRKCSPVCLDGGYSPSRCLFVHRILF